MGSFRAWRDRRALRKLRGVLPEELWAAVWARLPLLAGLSAEASARLRDLALLFLHRKSLEGAAGLVLDDEMRLTIALQACLPVLELGLEWYDGWVSLIVYPDEFVPEREWTDANGIAWRSAVPLMGEAWQRGPLILSWSDVAAGAALDGVNVVVHECAHKIDMVNGRANGHPPLHRGMDVARWTAAFTRAYEDLSRRIQWGEIPPINPYGAESPGEFFAVLSEEFFERPAHLAGVYPEVHQQLVAFYRQDPGRRLGGSI